MTIRITRENIENIELIRGLSNKKQRNKCLKWFDKTYPAGEMVYRTWDATTVINFVNTGPENKLMLGYLSTHGLIPLFYNDCDFSNVDFSHVHMNSFHFVKCNFSKAKINESELTNVCFLDCNLSEVDFQKSKLTDVNFTKSILNNTLFSYCTMYSISVYNTKMSNVNLANSNINIFHGFYTAEVNNCRLSDGSL